jgi:hypothetical protein
MQSLGVPPQAPKSQSLAVAQSLISFQVIPGIAKFENPWDFLPHMELGYLLSPQDSLEGIQ